MTKAIDPTRPVLETSGWAHTLPNPELRDDHDYNQDPAVFKQRWEDFFAGREVSRMPPRYGAPPRDFGVPMMVSEFGGTFWGENAGGWGYGSGPKTVDEFYTRYEGLVDALLDNPNMFGFCYTQLTDVEQEHNGLFYYDRRPKFDLKRLHAITSRRAAYEQTGPIAARPVAPVERSWQVLVGAVPDGELSKPYRYTTDQPGADWAGETFDDAAWPTGLAPFGTINNPRTPWKSDDIWLRRTFDYSGENFREAALVVFYDEDTEVFINGQKIWSRSGFVTAYQMFTVTDAMNKSLKNGRNTLAIHTHQSGGGQFIDLAILVE